jgi:hypothetical protein
MRWSLGSGVLGVAAVAMVGVVACGSSGTNAASGNGGGGAPRVTITQPADGASVRVPFTLKFTSSVTLGPTDSGRDHVHVFADGKTDQYTVVPTTSFEVQNLSPGRHTIGVTLQHADHSPAGANAQITVTVTGTGGAAPSGQPSTGSGGGYGY